MQSMKVALLLVSFTVALSTSLPAGAWGAVGYRGEAYGGGGSGAAYGRYGGSASWNHGSGSASGAYGGSASWDRGSGGSASGPQGGSASWSR